MEVGNTSVTGEAPCRQASQLASWPSGGLSWAQMDTGDDSASRLGYVIIPAIRKIHSSTYYNSDVAQSRGIPLFGLLDIFTTYRLMLLISTYS